MNDQFNLIRNHPTMGRVGVHTGTWESCQRMRKTLETGREGQYVVEHVALPEAQRKCRAGERCNAVERRALGIEVSRLDDALLERLRTRQVGVIRWSERVAAGAAS